MTIKYKYPLLGLLFLSNTVLELVGISGAATNNIYNNEIFMMECSFR